MGRLCQARSKCLAKGNVTSQFSQSRKKSRKYLHDVAFSMRRDFQTRFLRAHIICILLATKREVLRGPSCTCIFQYGFCIIHEKKVKLRESARISRISPIIRVCTKYGNWNHIAYRSNLVMNELFVNIVVKYLI